MLCRKRNCISLFIGFLILFCPNTYSQNYGGEPKWEKSVYLLDSAGNKELEVQTVSLKQKTSASLYIVGLGKVKVSNCVSGTSSPTKILAPDTLRLIARDTGNAVNPKQIFQIFELKESKDSRCLVTGQAGAYSGAKLMDIDYLNFEGSKYGKSSYLIELYNINPGHYALTFSSDRSQFHLFTILDKPHVKPGFENIAVGGHVYFDDLGGKPRKGKVLEKKELGVRVEFLNDFAGKKVRFINYEYLYDEEKFLEKTTK